MESSKTDKYPKYLIIFYNKVIRRFYTSTLQRRTFKTLHSITAVSPLNCIIPKKDSIEEKEEEKDSKLSDIDWEFV